MKSEVLMFRNSLFLRVKYIAPKVKLQVHYSSEATHSNCLGYIITNYRNVNY